MVGVILLLLFLVDAFSSADSRLIKSYNAVVRNNRSLLSMNPKGMGDSLLGSEVVGKNKLARADGHEVVKRAKDPFPHENYDHNITTKKDGAVAFPLGHSPGIGHDEPPGL